MLCFAWRVQSTEENEATMRKWSAHKDGHQTMWRERVWNVNWLNTLLILSSWEIVLRVNKSVMTASYFRRIQNGSWIQTWAKCENTVRLAQLVGPTHSRSLYWVDNRSEFGYCASRLCALCFKHYLANNPGLKSIYIRLPRVSVYLFPLFVFLRDPVLLIFLARTSCSMENVSSHVQAAQYGEASSQATASQSFCLLFQLCVQTMHLQHLHTQTTRQPLGWRWNSNACRFSRQVRRCAGMKK